jgi:hypothetical protein
LRQINYLLQQQQQQQLKGYKPVATSALKKENCDLKRMQMHTTE